mgnify:CR=1 FL=1
MWTIIKFEKNKLSLVKNEFINKLGKEVSFYEPKFKITSYTKSKKIIKDISVLGDYLLCFHKDFAKKTAINSLRYCRGLKYFLSNYLNSQHEIEKFINYCKKSEDEKGYLKYTYFDFNNKKGFEFLSGPFRNLVFTTLEQNKSYLSSLIGKYQIIVSKKNNLIRPI